MADQAATAGEAPRFWPRFLKLLPMMFVFGIVGPIFLFAYFALDEPGTGWMLGWGVAIVVLDVALAFGIAFWSYRSAAKMHRLRLNGKRAQADILEFQQTGTRINDQPLIRLTLRIHGPDVAPFEVATRKVVPITLVPLLHRGALAVLVDPETQEWEIDWDGSASLNPAPASPLPPTQTAEQRLAELDALRDKELISNEEYAATRQRILDDI